MQTITKTQVAGDATRQPSRISLVQLRLLAAMTEAPMNRFRRGWAHDRSGPFFKDSSVLALSRRGIVTIAASRRHAKIQT